MSVAPQFSSMDLLIGVVAFALLALLLVSRRPRHRSPPGPAGIPLLGNIFGLPKRSEWLTYWRWSHEYGEWVACPSKCILMTGSVS